MSQYGLGHKLYQVIVYLWGRVFEYCPQAVRILKIWGTHN